MINHFVIVRAFRLTGAQRQQHQQRQVYLSGGERVHIDVADFPRLGKRLVRIDTRAIMYDLDSGAPLPSPGFDLL